MNRLSRCLRVLLPVLACGAVLAAPAAAAGPMVINPQAGVTWSNYAFDDDVAINDESGRVGYALGGNVRFGQKMYFAPGLFYQQTGFEATATDTVSATDITEAVGVNALHIPLYLGYNLGATSVGFRVYAGPSLTIVTGVADNEFGLEKDDFESSIWGGVLGAGLDLTTVTFDLNYEIGLSEVFADAPGGGGAKQNVLRGLVGLKF